MPPNTNRGPTVVDAWFAVAASRAALAIPKIGVSTRLITPRLHGPGNLPGVVFASEIG
jgi:hypothetical protein